VLFLKTTKAFPQKYNSLKLLSQNLWSTQKKSVIFAVYFNGSLGFAAWLTKKVYG
jgi:hypothetical protein